MSWVKKIAGFLAGNVIQCDDNINARALSSNKNKRKQRRQIFVHKKGAGTLQQNSKCDQRRYNFIRINIFPLETAFPLLRHIKKIF